MGMALKRLVDTEGEANSKAPRVTLHYHIILSGADIYTAANTSAVETAVDAFLAANLPTSYDGRTEISRSVKMGMKVVKVDVVYDTAGTGQNQPVSTLVGGAADGFTPPATTGAGTDVPGVNDPLDQSLTIGLGTGSDTIKRSFQTLASGSRLDGIHGTVILDTPNYHNFINISVKDGGKPEVAELQIPWGKYITFDLSRKIKAVDRAYVITLSRMLYTTNIKTWQHHTAGTLLFLGCQLQYVGLSEGWRGSFKFAMRPNAKAHKLLASYPGIATDPVPQWDMPAHRAWDYAWVLVDYKIDPDTKLEVPKPRSYYIEQVVAYSDFALLRIGASSGASLPVYPAAGGVMTINDLQT